MPTTNGREQVFNEGIKNNDNRGEDTSADYLVTQNALDGTYGKIAPSNLPISTPDATTTVKGKVKLAGDLAGTADLPTVPGLANKVTANSEITGATNTKITYDSKGLVTSGTSLIASDIPNISESQVTGLVSDLGLKAPLASPALTDTPTAPTASPGTNTTQLATTAFVQDAINTDVSVQKIVDNPNRYATVDGGNSTVSFLLGGTDERFFQVNISDGTNRNIVQVDNTSAGFVSETPTGNCGMQSSTGTLIIYQNNTAIGKQTNIDVESSIADTLWSTPAYSTDGNYKYASQPKEYSVATLPTPTGSDNRFAIVTDALSPTYMTTIVGGGSVVCPVFYNGSTWVAN